MFFEPVEIDLLPRVPPSLKPKVKPPAPTPPLRAGSPDLGPMVTAVLNYLDEQAGK